MFDMGFIKDLRRILRRCPPYHKRQTMLFSATLSIRVMELAYEHTNNAEKVEIEPERVLAHGITRVALPRLLVGEVPPAARPAREGRRQPRPHLREPPHDRGRPRARALGQRLPDPRARRQRAAGPAPEDARGVQGRPPRRPGRDGRGLPRPPHRRRLPRHQLRPAGRLRGLRPPHRPHGPRRRPGHRGLVRVRRLRLLARRDREAHRPQDPGRVAARRASSARAASPRPRAPTPASAPAPTPAASPRPSRSRPPTRISAGRSGRAADGSVAPRALSANSPARSRRE